MKLKFPGIRNYSLSQLQTLNQQLYEVQNDRYCYDAPVMISKMTHHSGKILKGVRKGKLTGIGYHAAMTFSWSFALANRFHLTTEEEIWSRFPGVCPYCNRPVCRCGENRPRNRKKVVVDQRLRPSSCHGYQQMFARIYPQKLAKAASHLSEEVGEVEQALRYYVGTHEKRLFDEIVLELTDVQTMVFAVATSINVDIATEMGLWFDCGCPGCKNSPCRCKYMNAAEELGLMRCRGRKVA